MLLAISTSNKTCSCTLQINQNEEVFLSSPNQSEEICSIVNECFSHRGISWKDITHLLVDIGPGSFTGIRVGTAYASGIIAAAGGKVKPIGISMLEALSGEEKNITTFISANKDEYYTMIKSDDKFDFGILPRLKLEELMQGDSKFATTESYSELNNLTVHSADARLLLKYATLNPQILSQQRPIEPLYIKNANINTRKQQ